MLELETLKMTTFDINDSTFTMNIGLNEDRPCMRFSIGKLALS